MPNRRRNTADTFWSRIDRSGGDNSCWVWTGGRYPRGYGRIVMNCKVLYAHRVAYELTYGSIPTGMHVCHACDNPPCCNPAHLWLGSPADNVADRDAKGRHRYVKPAHIDLEARLSAKLNWNKVRQIREMWASGVYSKRGLARIFSVHESIVRGVIANECWHDESYTPPARQVVK